MKIAIGSDVMPEDGPAAAAASNASASAGGGKVEAVEAEVVTGDGNDPWGKK